MVNTAEGRLAAAGIELPPPPAPFGAYMPAVQTGNLLFLTGMLPTVGHEAKFLGRAGRELNAEQGRKARRDMCIFQRHTGQHRGYGQRGVNRTN